MCTTQFSHLQAALFQKFQPRGSTQFTQFEAAPSSSFSLYSMPLISSFALLSFLFVPFSSFFAKMSIVLKEVVNFI
jgi:hypothetical protein